MPDKPATAEAALHTQSPRYTAHKIALIYAGISVLWILFSDQLLSALVNDIDTMTRIQMVKGWIFILATSYLIFLLLHRDIKKYSRVEEALRYSREQLLSLMDTLPTAVSWADARGNIEYSNKKFHELFGYTLEDIPTVEQWFALAYPDQGYRETVVSRWQIAIEKARDNIQEIEPIEVTINCKDGSTRYVAIRGALVRDRILAVFNDLSGRKRAENALKESENRYRTLFDSANDAILILQNDVFIDCNQKALEMFGSTREQIIGQTPYQLSPPHQPDGRDSREITSEKIANALSGNPDVFEWRHLRLSGEAFDTEVSLSLMEIESKKYIQAIVRDISLRRRLDRDLRVMQHWIEESIDLFFWVRGDSQILYVNKAVCRSLGYTKEEMGTMRVSDFDLELPQEAWPDFAQKLKKQGSHYIETRFRTKTGQVFPMEITANIMKYEGVDHFFAYGRNISERVQYENEQKKLEKQLQQAQKMESLGTLAGGIAHDFNNILGAILGYAEMVESDLPPNSPIREMQHGVITAGLRAKELVQQILLFSRQAEHEAQPVQPHLIVKEALKLLRSTIPVTIKIHQYIDAYCGTIYADPTQIHQIVMNLCTNAYHAMRQSGGVLGVSLSQMEITKEDISFSKMQLDPGSYVKLEVSDTGHGMDKTTLENIFNPYFTTKPKGEGTGLGLSVVLGIVKSFGGHIHFYSEPGSGTTANVYFPRLETRTDALQTPVKKQLPTGSERILIVDDEKALLDMMKMSLEALGYEVVIHSGSQGALEAINANPDYFDLVITDMTMPHMTGLEMAGKIFMVRPNLPVIMCTGFSELITKEKAHALGIRALLTKPILRADLAISVRKAIDNAPSASQETRVP